MPITFEIVHTSISAHANVYEVISDSYIFYIWQEYFFHIYDHLSILYLGDMFVFSVMPITFIMVHPYVPTHNATAIKC